MWQTYNLLCKPSVSQQQVRKYTLDFLKACIPLCKVCLKLMIHQSNTFTKVEASTFINYNPLCVGAYMCIRRPLSYKRKPSPNTLFGTILISLQPCSQKPVHRYTFVYDIQMILNYLRFSYHHHNFHQSFHMSRNH